MRIIFWAFLTICIGALSWFAFGQDRSFEELAQRFEDNFDSRPAREILMLGNSRTFFNDMPHMLRAIADSAGSPRKYQITRQLPPGASLEILWKARYTQSLLQQSWDDAIVQAESRAFSGEIYTKSFMTYGAKLIEAIKLKSGWPRLVVNWAYEPTAEYTFTESDRRRFQNDIDSGHERLAQMAGARLIKLGKVWNSVRSQHPEITMTTDGNHPTLAGSYLYALLLYKDLSKGDVAKVSFVPDGLSDRTATIMKDAVARYSPLGW